MELARIGKRKRPLRRLHPAAFTGGSSLCAIGETATRCMDAALDARGSQRSGRVVWRPEPLPCRCDDATLGMCCLLRPPCKRDDATAMGGSATADVESPHGARQPRDPPAVDVSASAPLLHATGPGGLPLKFPLLASPCS